ncbi:MAG TPA: YhcH/YjgK/YiaL family protein [Vicinamibacterales bacterium]|nr:YhcH/YjgK/YiaL family protein [Vicinamibacterales bacterium]
MVADLLSNAAQYRSLSPRIARALDFLSQGNLATLADGKHPIDGENMFAIVQRTRTQPPGEGRWEAHRRYIDVQYLVKGTERIGVGHISRFTQEPYDPELEVLWLSGEGDYLTFREGTFMIFWPNDAHLPRVMMHQPADVMRVVVKIAVE